MKNVLAYFLTLNLMLGVTTICYAQTAAPAVAPNAQAPAMQAEPGMEGRDHHREIHKAIHTLENAKNDLEHAAHDYDGHRVKAIEHIDGALYELHQALESVK